jgi:hypothetical protein
MPTAKLGKRVKRRLRMPRDLVPLSEVSGAGRYFAKMVRDVKSDLDLNNSRRSSRIADELIEVFCGCATALRYQTHEILLGDEEIDLSGYAQLASTMLRIGSRLGIEPRLKQVASLDEFLQQRTRSEPSPSPPTTPSIEPEIADE